MTENEVKLDLSFIRNYTTQEEFCFGFADDLLYKLIFPLLFINIMQDIHKMIIKIANFFIILLLFFVFFILRPDFIFYTPPYIYNK